MPPDWFQNDELFFNQLSEGHRWAEHVGRAILAEGIAAKVTPMEIRTHITLAGEFADEHDLTVGTRASWRIDVKSLNLDFTGEPSGYPYATALVDTVQGWEAKTHLPHAVVLVSQRTGALLVIPVSTRELWTKRRRYDNVRGIHDWFYEIEKSRLRTFADLVAWLRLREQEPSA